MNPARSLALLLFLFLAAKTSLTAQQTVTHPADAACSMPSFSGIVTEPNIFNEQQEQWLGEILDPQIRKQYNIIDDPEHDYLQKLGERLLAQLSPTHVHYSFTIIDFPENDSFGLAGGHIYLSRRIIAMAENEDELAGLLGHEIGHIITHQSAIDATRELKAVLGVTEVGDRKDILDKWNRLLDTAATKSAKHSERREQQEQLIADRIALHAMARAGYQPSRFADFFDRLAQTKGKTGNFWSDLFGKTSPDSRRLRELVRNVELPPNCMTPLAADTAPRFLKWKNDVIASGFAVAREELPGLMKKVSLDPPLRVDLRLIQFSPDGKYLLAQDESSVFVLSRSPLENLFRIDAPDSSLAQFTPDSRFIVFSDKELRVEKWDLESKQRASVHQVTLPMDCDQSALSPTGDIMACISAGYELRLVDVPANGSIYSRKSFYKPQGFEILLIELMDKLGAGGNYPDFQMHFSPDGRYFAIGHDSTNLVYDLKARSELKLEKHIKSIMESHFVFKGPDEIDGFDWDNGKHRLNRLRFPSGEVVDRFALVASGNLSAPAKGDYLLLSRDDRFRVSMVDLTKKKATLSFQLPGVAVYDDIFAAETDGGGIALVHASDNKVFDILRLPYSPLQSARVSSFSGDSRWLALSGPTRGAIWNLDSGKRTTYILGFEGATFDQDDLIAKFPKRGSEAGHVAQFRAAGSGSTKLYELQREEQESEASLTVDQATYYSLRALESRFFQLGPLLIKVIPRAKSSGGGRLMVVCDVRNNEKLWEQAFSNGLPRLFYSRASDTLTMLTSYQEADTRGDPALKAQLDAIPKKTSSRDAYVLKVADARSGKALKTVVVDTGHGSFSIRTLEVTPKTVLVRDSDNRTLLYSLQSGKQLGKLFGAALAVSKSGEKMLVETGRGKADLVDISTLQPLAHYTFPSHIVWAEFADDGNLISVLTGDQTVYQLKTAMTQDAAAR